MAVIILFCVGLAGTILPVLPGVPIIFLGVLVYGLFTHFETLPVSALVILGMVTLLVQVLEYVAGAFGVKRFGGTRWGILGAILGGLFGAIVFSLPGLIIGTFLGTILMEIALGRKAPREALSIGWGSLLGYLGGTLMKFAMALVMIAIFLAYVL